MQDLRPPSYRAINTLDSHSTTLVSTSNSWLTDDLCYDPPATIFARDLESREIQLHNRPIFPPIRRQTAPEPSGQRSLISPLSVAPPRPFPTEKRRPTVARPRPTASESICYAFSPMGFSSMVLTPTVDDADNEPQYYITIQMNCFMPLSFFTRVHRFSSNEKVGEFEMGITTVPSTVQIGPKREFISNILSKSGGRNSGSWFWNPLAAGTKYCLKWDYDKRPSICRSTFGEKPILALFTSPFGFNSGSEVAMLEVTPAGQELFDHVLISLLIIERKRLTPDRENGLKPLFS